MPAAITPPAASPVETKQQHQNQQTTTTANKPRKVICFSDFDGTIFHQDTGHLLFDAFGCGTEGRAALEADLASGKRTFKDMSESLWGSLHVPFDDGFRVMRDALEIDSGFQAFHKFCVARDIPFHIISAGLKPVLRRVLDEFLGEEESRRIGIMANDAVITGDGESWKPVWRHGDSELGHDKALTMGEVKKEVADMAAASAAAGDDDVPLIVFIGDGVSDLPAARQADVLFARKGLRLEEYCVEHGIPYIPFDSFADVQKEIEKIVGEDEAVTGGKGLPQRFNPRANLWRRVSSKNAVHRFAALTPAKEEKMFLWPEVYTELVDQEAAAAATIPAPAAG